MFDLNSPNSDPSTSGISSEPSLSGEYDVFLSFCGKDTRKGFTDFLYTDLRDAGVRTFRDDNELRVGEEIGPELTNAIENSKICIPIFSKNYAFSKWCLLELAHVVKCHAEANGEKVIFPIFYDVEPHDVRHQSGSYEEAFRQHEKKKRLEGQTVQIWKEALAKVGQLKGFELEKETGGHEGELAKRTLKECLRLLKKHHQHVPLNMVGMENHIRKLKRLLEVDSNEVRIVGINGMGGLGKTTMAKIIYNQLCQHFEAHCFVENIRENSSPRGNIVTLQSQLISKIQNRGVEQFNDFNEGCSRIKEAVRGRKLLIVLDDADDKFQVDMLMGNGSWFGVKSRIIITTRNKSVLSSIERACQREDLHYASYEPEFMNEHDSLQLFSKYAFRRDSPFEAYNILSEEVVSIAVGLPLVLVVLGSTFSEVEGIDLWEENVRKLREIPNREILKTLKFSFDALTREEKEIFLDIACLVIGKNAEICSYMWDDCKYYPRNGINVLINKSLITIGSKNEFKMHDQLRDLGRHIVDEESLKKLGKRSRLWRKDEAMDVLETNQGTSFINALRLPEHDEPNSLSEIPLSGSRLQNVANLRYLTLGSRDIDGDFTALLSKLRWLQWKCVGTFKPKKLHMENLVVLDLSRSTFTDDWEGWNQINVCLSENNFTAPIKEDQSNLLFKYTDISLIMFGKKLKNLDLSYCKGIRVLGHFSMCTSLESLNLSGSSVCRIDGLGSLKALKYLDASRCWNLETLSGLSDMTKLVRLQLAGCKTLSEIQGLEKLESLRDLILDECVSLSRLPDLSNLKMLKNFNGSSCEKLIEIVGLDKLESLEILDLEECKSLERLPDVSKLKNLISFEAPWCKKLIKVEGVHKLNALEHLDLRECISLNGIPDISNLSKLMFLVVSGLGLDLELKTTCFKKLKYLDMSYRDEIQFPCGFESLETLHIYNCEKLIKIQGLDKLQSLISLEVYSCPCLESLTDLPNFGNLQKLKVEDCYKLRDVAALGVVESLEELWISDCYVLREIPDLRSCKGLKKLFIYSLRELTGIHGLEDLKSLEYLNISECPSINFSREQKKIINSFFCTRLCIFLHKLDDARPILWIEHCDSISCLAFEKGFIYSGSWDKTLKVWRLSDLKCLESIKAHDDAINGIIVINGVVYSASADGKIKIWERQLNSTHSLKGILEGHKDVSLNLVVRSDDGEVIYGASSDGYIMGWYRDKNHDNWKLVCEVKAHKMAVLCVCLKGEILCSGSADKSIGIWKISTRGGLCKIGIIQGHEGPIKCLQASPNIIGGGFLLYSGSLDKSLSMVDTYTLQQK